jgi:cell division septum initiation protein DivIVA
MDVKDLLALASDPAKYKAIIENIESQRQALAKDIQAHGAIKDIEKARAEAQSALEDAKKKADSIVKDGEAQAARIRDEARLEAEKVAKQKKEVGLKLDAVVADELVIASQTKALAAREVELDYALKAARDEVAQYSVRNKELEDKLVKLRGIL